MDKRTDKSEGTTPTRNEEALRILASCLSQAFESNRAWRKFCDDPQERADQEAELAELEKADAWFATLPEGEIEIKPRSAIRLVYGSLEAVDTHDLTRELMRRGCAVAVISHEDVADQWQMNQDADGTDDPKPTEQETRDALACVQKLLEKTLYDNQAAFQWGPTSDACELIAKWRKEGGRK